LEVLLDFLLMVNSLLPRLLLLLLFLLFLLSRLLLLMLFLLSRFLLLLQFQLPLRGPLVNLEDTWGPYRFLGSYLQSAALFPFATP
jgi:hypothetical protein